MSKNTFELRKNIQAVSVPRWRKTARQVSSGLKIQVDPHAQYENPYLVVSGRLENHSSKPQRVPLYGPTPFSVRFEEDQEQIRQAHVLGRPDGEVEVIELELTIPPQSAVNFKDRLDLSLYRYKGTPTVSIHWDFGLKTDPASEGHFSITLPKPPFTGAAYNVEQEFVTEKVFAERLNQLKGQEGWYCTLLASFNGPSGGETGWVSREGLLGKKFHVRHTQLGDNSWHEIYRQ
jgi:hypothetical protein